MSNLQIGQYRFKSVSDCIEEISCQKSYKNSVISGGIEEKTDFKDILVSVPESFVAGEDYCLSISIPQDYNYNLDFSIKLIKQEQGNEVFQFLKIFSILKGGTGFNVYDVVLYEDQTGEVKASIPKEKTNEPSVLNEIYVEKTEDGLLSYYLGIENGEYKLTDNYNDLSVSASWRESELDKKYSYLDLIFRPVENDFYDILLEIQRTAEDYNIQNLNDENEIEYGRVVPIDLVTCKIYKIKNLVDVINLNGTLSKIGIWSHPDLVMSINGEEIRIGKSGYYELTSLPVESFGVLTKDLTDVFTLDYQYSIETEEEN